MTFPETELNKVKRIPDRARYDKETIYPIIDEALICHVGFTENDQPFVIPALHARDGDTLILHGAKASRMMQHIGDGSPVCIAITHVDGIVFARSVFHHSINYRSAVIFGHGKLIKKEDEKMRALEMLTEHIAQGRWHDARLPNQKELAATSVVKIEIESATAKIRSGDPKDDKEDYDLPVWSGMLPIAPQYLSPLNDPTLAPGIVVPDYILNYTR
ncbi:MAG: pyridoxamine 5'-phosphate oxidase family protein [Chloroflexi bacterium]|nr:pyridoxamine 5'-phosphate oxidase family protein [Chloroflexota bacterium]